MNNQAQLYVMQFRDHQVVLIGKATQERDHGDLFWMCQTFSPCKQVMQPVGYYKQEVRKWFEDQFGEVDIVEGTLL